MIELYRIAASRLTQLPDGSFVWKDIPEVRLHLRGKPAGNVYPSGYVYIRCDNGRVLGHRLAWFMRYGELPADQIDHANMVKSDNRIENLRLASFAENNRNRPAQSNNRLGIKGVSYHKRSKAYIARILVNGRRVVLGYFKTASEAGQAYERAAKEHHGQFART